MGTLAGHRDRLPGYCDHKLPTSCVLSSIPECCACADERGHAPSYPTYIDGVGFVPRGTRWQRYCWYCCTFWENRVAITNLQPQQTRIPDRPDQSEFLAKWYEFHRGYRIVKRPDGSESRVAVLGEPWSDVEPGLLPRTLDELRAGRDRSDADERQHVETVVENTVNGPSLDETLDSMLADLDAEGGEATHETDEMSHTRIAGNVMQPISPSYHSSTQAREEQRNATRLRREQRAAENFRRIFGTREDVESDDYVSPIHRMFTRAWDRRRQAEQAEQAQSTPDVRPSDAVLNRPHDVVTNQGLQPTYHRWQEATGSRPSWAVPYDFPVNPAADPVIRAALLRPRDEPPDLGPRGLDVDDTRPEPKTEEEMTIKLECKVCFSQLADTVLLPCGHLIMCHWCSEQYCPTLERDHTRPTRATACPLCRKSVRQKYSVKVA